MTALDTALAGLAPSDVSYRLLGGLFKVLPGAPEVPFYGSLAEAQRLVAPGADLTRAAAFAESDAAARVLKVANAIDVGDAGISVYTGISSVLSFFFGSPQRKKSALETDPQQGADAALKALAIAYMTSQLYEGGVALWAASDRRPRAPLVPPFLGGGPAGSPSLKRKHRLPARPPRRNSR